MPTSVSPKGELDTLADMSGMGFHPRQNVPKHEVNRDFSLTTASTTVYLARLHILLLLLPLLLLLLILDNNYDGVAN